MSSNERKMDEYEDSPLEIIESQEAPAIAQDGAPIPNVLNGIFPSKNKVF